MIINFITPKLSRKRFSGGIYCILKHADELTKQGHTVNVIPLYGGRKPEWIQCSANFLINKAPECREKKKYKCFVSSLSRLSFGMKSENVKFALQLDHMKGAIPEGDITIATHWVTVEPVYKYGTGVKAYFMQHYEPVMFTDTETYDYYKCVSSYLLPIVKIANSQWAQRTVERALNDAKIEQKVWVANNAIELTEFKKLNLPSNRSHGKHIKIISYSGRGVDWKGFSEMANAIDITRTKLPDWEIEWLVYGDNPDSKGDISTEYTNLGFLQTKDLIIEYNKADILLSASWYESFPLFPIEAMACGLATITTQFGTEEYAIHGETAEIVEPKNPESISKSLIKLITDKVYRIELAERGHQKSKNFSWHIAGENMEKTLTDIIGQ